MMNPTGSVPDAKREKNKIQMGNYQFSNGIMFIRYDIGKVRNENPQQRYK
jgi:hypothetical protein